MFSVILADPAWHFKTYSAKGEDRSPQKYYKTMSIDDIKALPVSKVAGRDCVLLLWAVDPLLPEAISVGEAWGFTYKTVAFTWAKQVASRTNPNFLPVGDDFHWHMGTGYHTRANPEMCLLFTRGNPKRLSQGIRQLVVAPVQEHSRKPDSVHERIEKLYNGRRLELFGRKRRHGWTVLGNEINGQHLNMSLNLLAFQVKRHTLIKSKLREKTTKSPFHRIEKRGKTSSKRSQESGQIARRKRAQRKTLSRQSKGA